MTAHDFAYGIERTLDPERRLPYAYVLGFVVKGADAYNAGVTDESDDVASR